MGILHIVQQANKERWYADQIARRAFFSSSASPFSPTWSEPPSVAPIRCYVLVNDLLPTIHGGIQAAHALSDFTYYQRELPILKEWVEKHKTLILLSATTTQMTEMRLYFSSRGLQFSTFREPDLDNLETAVAFEPMSEAEGKIIFGQFPLFK